MSMIVLPKSGRVSTRGRVGYNNLLELGTITASSENPAYPVVNVADWLPSDFFRPMAAGTVNIDLTLPRGLPADYFAFYGQDLYKYGGNIRLQYHNGTTFVDATPGITPANNAPRMVFFTAKYATRWRVVITCSSIFNIGIIAFGHTMLVPRGMYTGWTPPVFGRATKLVNSVSDSGVFLGRAIYQNGVSTSLNVQYMPDDWARTHWLPFMKHAELKPFFYAPDMDKRPNDAAFCWADNGVNAPTHSAYGFMSASFTINGVVE